MKKAIKKLKKQVSGILDILELIPTRAELQTVAKHVQNLEAEKCSCHTNKPKAEFDKELFGKLFTENFQEESKEIKVNAVNEMMHKGKSIVDVMKESMRNYRDWETDRKSTRLNSSHRSLSRMPSSA